MVQPVEQDARGILDPGRGLQRFQLHRHAPEGRTARFVDRIWVPSWDLRGQPAHRQTVLAHPVVNVVFEVSGAVVLGVQRHATVKVLEGRGRALGVMFRPAGFRAFVDRPLRELTGRRLPIGEVLGSDAERLAARIVPALAGDAPEDELVGEVQRFLVERSPVARQPCEALSELIEQAAGDPSIHRVDQLAARAGVSARHLQRRFADEVGVSPKWVLRRYRLYDAAEVAARGRPVDWAALADLLGFSDQAHLTRAFTAAVGIPPARYARSVEPLPRAAGAGERQPSRTAG